MKMSHKYILLFGGKAWSETKYCANWNDICHVENSKKVKQLHLDLFWFLGWHNVDDDLLISWMKTERVSTTL